MAVLAQKIIPADFAYVIHTKNPSTNNSDEVYAEVVVGMGETLVGTFEGQSFAFTYNKSKNKLLI
jgi:alpha-glucan,water dikinase